MAISNTPIFASAAAALVHAPVHVVVLPLHDGAPGALDRARTPHLGVAAVRDLGTESRLSRSRARSVAP